MGMVGASLLGVAENRNLVGTMDSFQMIFQVILVELFSPEIRNIVLLKALVVKNSVLHDFGFGKVSQIHKTFLMELQLFGWRHFSKTEVVQNTVLNH